MAVAIKIRHAVASGSFLRGLGFPQQLRHRSESAHIFEGLKANKTGLSKKLDSVLKNSHDMRIFGLGFLRSCASHAEYAHFMQSHYHFYIALEETLSLQCSQTSAIGRIWNACPELHGAPKRLETDLCHVGIDAKETVPSSATAAYANAIKHAAARDRGDLLISHFYTRYLADLFGGSMLASPTSAALGLQPPQFYKFPEAVETQRASYIEHVYASINKEGEKMDDIAHEGLVEEARCAFTHNAAVYMEQPKLFWGAFRGAFNIGRGMFLRKVALR